jgi:uncharacterized membrane protein YdjX (TVP38/TMEM64 family)
LWWKKFLLILFLAGGLVIFLYGGRWLDFYMLQENRDFLLDYTGEHYWSMLGVSILIYSIFTAFGFPGELLLVLLMGFLFGRWVGTVVTLFSATLGATLLFLAARYLFAKAALQRLQKKRLAKKVIQGFHSNAFHFLLFLRLVPLFPFWLINLAAAFTPISTCTYILATAIGIAPASFILANLGQSLRRVDSLQDLLSTEVIVSLVLLGLLALIPVLLKRYSPGREIWR